MLEELFVYENSSLKIWYLQQLISRGCSVHDTTNITRLELGEFHHLYQQLQEHPDPLQHLKKLLQMDKMFTTSPQEIKVYMEKEMSIARQHGYVETLFGRRCFVEDINNKIPYLRQFAERAAINAPVQGTAADIIKSAMIRLFDQLKAGKIILQVHDELLVEVKDEKVQETAKLVKDVMENAVKISVPLEVEVKISDNWGSNFLNYDLNTANSENTLKNPEKQTQQEMEEIAKKLQEELPKEQEQKLQGDLRSLKERVPRLQNENEKKIFTFVLENRGKIFNDVNQKIKSLSEENFLQFLFSAFEKIREKNLASKENLENNKIKEVINECVDDIRGTEAKDSLIKLAGWPFGIKVDPKNISGSFMSGLKEKVPFLGGGKEEDEPPLSDEEMMASLIYCLDAIEDGYALVAPEV
uniref:POLAc domain-containing protein n=1 Tax=Rhodnius prolixus TaxID=13249 RepID=T1HRC7_RHOPR